MELVQVGEGLLGFEHLADGLDEVRRKSTVTPGSWLEQLNGCCHCL